MESVDGQVADERRHKADEDTVPQAHKASGRRDRHQAHHCADAGTDGGHFAVAVAVEEDPRDHGSRRREVGVGKGQHRIRTCGKGRSGVEPKPAKPQQASSQNDKRDVGRGQLAVHATSQEQRAGKGRATGRHVHHRSSRKVQHPPLAEQAVRMPCHVTQGWIHDEREQHHKQDVRTETHAPRHAARDEGGRDDGKLELKQSKQQERHGASEIGVGAQPHSPEGQERPRIPDDASKAVPKAQAEAHQHPKHADDPQGHKALEHRGNDVLFVDHPPIEEGQTWRHQQHKRTGDDHPRGVARVQGRQGGFVGGRLVRRAQKPNRRHQQRQHEKVALSAHEIEKMRFAWGH